MSSLATSYSEMRYAEGAPSKEGVEAAWHDVDELRAALDAPLGPIAKVRSRLSMRSLRRDRGSGSDSARKRVSETA
jgi:hypothetical protein